MSQSSSTEITRIRWDVVVVGYGSAGAAAAIEAAQAGARVLLVEKMEQFGGNSVLSAGYLRVAEDAAGAAAYLDAACGGRVERPVIEALAEGMTELIPYLEQLAQPLEATVFQNLGQAQTAEDTGDLYQWPGRESFGWTGIESIPGFNGYPWIYNGGRGQNLLRVLEANVQAQGVEVWFDTPVRELILEDGAVSGVAVEKDGHRIEIVAGGGVILACGGFEFDAELLGDYLEIPAIYGIGCPGNSGDGIRLAQQAGAALWHMWHVHGSYGFKFPEFSVAFRNHLGGVRRNKRQVAWILVNQAGKRFMNEVPPAPQDTPIRPLAHLDPEQGRFDRIPAWMIFDDEARRLGPVGKAIATVPEHYYEWSPDNSKEIERGWILGGANLTELAEKMRLPAETLASTIDRWNSGVAAGHDADFARLPGTLTPIATPPFYAVQVWPIVTNTQGGPRHDQFQRVVAASGKPVPGLYAVGELGSIFGHIYMLGGNLSECLVGGRIAGRRAAQGLDKVRS